MHLSFEGPKVRRSEDPSGGGEEEEEEEEENEEEGEELSGRVEIMGQGSEIEFSLLNSQIPDPSRHASQLRTCSGADLIISQPAG